MLTISGKYCMIKAGGGGGGGGAATKEEGLQKKRFVLRGKLNNDE